MKKWITVLLLVLILFMTSACMQEDDYYTRVDVDDQLAEVQSDFSEVEAALNAATTLIAQLQEQIEQQNELIEDLGEYIEAVSDDARLIVLTPQERYIFALVNSELMNEMQFAEVGTTITGVVLDYSYYEVVFEVYREMTVEIEIIQAAPDGYWDLDIFDFNGLLDENFNEIQNGDKYIITFYPGFNTLEFDSYLHADYTFIIKVTEVL